MYISYLTITQKKTVAQPFSFICNKNFLWSVTKERSCLSLLGFQNMNISTKEASETLLPQPPAYSKIANGYHCLNLHPLSTPSLKHVPVYGSFQPRYLFSSSYFFSFLSLNYGSLFECIKFIHSSGHFGRFQLRTIMNSVAMNTLIIAHYPLLDLAVPSWFSISRKEAK